MYGLHQGYSYQDLLAAFLISENLHRKDLQFAVELKDNKDDSFDDIVIVTDGKKNKFQVKHSSTNEKLVKNTFVNASSSLNFTKLAKSLSLKEDARYVIATNRDVQSDPCFVKRSKRKSLSLPSSTFSLDLGNATSKEFVQRLTIEASLPNASFDLSKPGSLEKELLESLRLNVGIGYYPNNQVSARDIAGRLILLANKLRGSKDPDLIDREYIFRHINLNFEYGHVAQDFPFISLDYRLYRNQIVIELEGLVHSNIFTVLEGPPGSGKSHIFDDLYTHIGSDTTLVVRHFCYLEPTDRFAQERIVVETMYGNFLYQLEKLEPEIAETIKPYFAATKSKVERLIDEIRKSGKRVVLMVDGLDHLNRVVAQNKLSPDLVKNFVADLLDMRLPAGCSLFIASQPSTELQEIILKTGAKVYSLRPWDKQLVREYVSKHNKLLPTERQLDTHPDTIRLLTEKTEGNPLYLTYILKEIVSISRNINFYNYVETLPKLNNDLNNYYRHLVKDITENDFTIVQTLALLDFSVSRNELTEMFPPIQQRVINTTLAKLRPILKPGVVQGGVRIYHESFRRFIIELAYRQGRKDRELYKHITDWLEKSDFFPSQRAYRYLIPYLIRSSEKKRTFALLKEDFIAKSLFYFHSTESIVANLNKVADYAARQQRWEMYCKAVELRRALHTFSEERLDYVDEVYHQAILSVQGVDMFCERMLFDGKPVFSKTRGILLCQMAEHKGGNPPWDYYDVAGLSMQVKSGSHIYEFQRVQSAHFLNLLRQSSLDDALKLMRRMIGKNTFTGTEQRQVDMLVAEFECVFGVSRNHEKLMKIRISQKKRRCLSLSVAKYLHRDGYKKEASQLCTKVIQQTRDVSQLLNAVLLGGKTAGLNMAQDIAKLTEKVLAIEYPGDKEKIIFKDWYETLIILSHAKPSVVRTAKKLVNHIDGWYRAWVLYLFDLALLEASSLTDRKKEERLVEALRTLNSYAHPFRGNPRACDLYSINDLCTDSFRRTLKMARKYSNYGEIVSLLSNISKKSTSYLQGASGGPLSGETFNSLLKDAHPSLDDSKSKIVKKLLEKNIQDSAGASVYYDSSAFEYLKLATVLSLNGQSQRPSQCLMDGCVHLGAYGHRKDVTIYELTRSIKFIAKKDRKFATYAFKKSFPLVETVWRYTDGKETIWSLSQWIETLVDSDIKTAVQTIAEMVQIDPERDWRVEIGTEYLCEKLLERKINPELIAELYETISQKHNTRIDVSAGLAITQALLNKKKKGRAQKLLDHICHELYCVSIFEYVSEKENFTKVCSFADRFGLKIKSAYATQFEGEDKKPTTDKLSLPKEKVPSFRFSKLSVDETRRLVDENPQSHFLRPKNTENFAKALLRFSDEHLDGVYDVLLSIARRGLYQDEDLNGLIALRDYFRDNGKYDVAAFVSMLGFVYGRGGGGWYAMADSKYNHLANDAFCLSKETAKKTLASEMSYLFFNAAYFIGPVRHFIEFFSQYAKVSMAKNIWDEAYKVTKFRLPTPRELDKVLANETPSLNYKRTKSVDTLLADLTNIRRTITG